MNNEKENPDVASRIGEYRREDSIRVIPLYDKCPELANQIIGFGIKDEDGLPDGKYVLLEGYCDNPECDCRNAIINIATAPPEMKHIAAISYGWESKRYYKSICDDEETANQLCGICLLEGEQSEWADAFSELFRKMIVERDLGRIIKEHYKLFRAVVRKEAGLEEQPSTERKIGRNDPCSCGSGKKYKMCCGK